LKHKLLSICYIVNSATNHLWPIVEDISNLQLSMRSQDKDEANDKI
jgi:hypothetical protein